MKRTLTTATLASLMIAAASPALAQQLQIPAFLEPAAGGANGGQTAGYIVQLFGFLTVLSLAPGILISVTAFTRFVVIFSIMRSGLGMPTTPANLILVSLSLFLTWYVMEPVANRAWEEGLSPMINNEISQEEGFSRAAEPFRQFMLANVRDQDLRLFADLADETAAADGGTGETPTFERRAAPGGAPMQGPIQPIVDRGGSPQNKPARDEYPTR